MQVIGLNSVSHIHQNGEIRVFDLTANIFKWNESNLNHDLDMCWRSHSTEYYTIFINLYMLLQMVSTCTSMVMNF